MTMKDRKCVFTTAQRGRIEQKIITKRKKKKRHDRGRVPESGVPEAYAPTHHFISIISHIPHCNIANH